MKSRDRVEMFRDVDGQWRWRFVRSNGANVGGSEEGYRRPGECRRGAITVTDADARGIPVVTVPA